MAARGLAASISNKQTQVSTSTFINDIAATDYIEASAYLTNTYATVPAGGTIVAGAFANALTGGSMGPATGNVLTDAAPGDAGDADTGADSLGADGG